MLQLFDQISNQVSRDITKTYSTSFSRAVRMLAPSIRGDIYNIYGYVRLADEIVDSFHGHDKSRMLADLRAETWRAIDEGISINPVVHSFQQTVNAYDIDRALIAAFLDSMQMDLEKTDYASVAEYEKYIYGSADVVGLMCLSVFVNGHKVKYDMLKEPAMKLGSAFQKVNFLRDLKDDYELLNRSYFPNLDLSKLDQHGKEAIIREIESDFKAAYDGIMALPVDARFGVYTAYRYYNALLKKLKRTPSKKILKQRVRISNPVKLGVFARSYLRYQLNML